MTSSKQPFSGSALAKRTEELIEERRTDVERWRQKESLAPQWDQRAVHAAKFIPNHYSVLDIGCGAMALEQYLGPECSYQPADVVERRAGCLVVDLNKGEFPDIKVDVITFLGVLEYVFDLSSAFRNAQLYADKLVFSYCVPTKEATAYRRGLGWVNDYSEDDIRGFLRATGWKIVRSELNKVGPNSNQMLFDCDSA